jgi:CBS domain containing-hemolysin-like protein
MCYNDGMYTLSLIGLVVFGALLTLVSSMMPRRAVLSNFELERRRRQGNQSASQELAREVLLGDVISLKHVTEALLLVITVLLSVATFGVIIGVIAGLAIALWYGRVARIELIHTWAMRLYEQWEPGILRFLDHAPQLMKFLRTVDQPMVETEISSREELEHLVEQAGAVLTDQERKMLCNGLAFNDMRVETIMTPRGVIDTVAHDETVGPLLLDELHKTGHSRFPVIDGDIDHVVGTLHIKELLTLGDKSSKTAAQAMESRVFYINQDQTLDHALAAFIKTRHHLFIVVNGYRETAGILTLEDVMEALLGREIVDEFDVHDDLRIVAARNAKTNNNPPHATNV